MTKEFDYECENCEDYTDTDDSVVKHYCEYCGAPIYEFDKCFYLSKEDVWLCEDCCEQKTA